MRVFGVEFLENTRKRFKPETDHNARQSTDGTFSTSHIPREPRLTVHRGLQVCIFQREKLKFLMNPPIRFAQEYFSNSVQGHSLVHAQPQLDP